MFLDIVVIVLRETLEASILIGVLLSISKNLGFKMTWVFMSLLAGSVASVSYGLAMGDVSEWFNYSGQEVVNAILQLSIYGLIVVLISLQWLQSMRKRRMLRNLMAVIVFLALVREGAELYVFYSGFLQKESVLVKALTSGFVGLSVGLSVGAIVFYSLALMNQSKIKIFHAAILTLVAAGMVLQATQLLIQVDWISSGEPLWNSNEFIAESSIVGQVAYAVFGYEATPSFVEMGIYAGSIIILVVTSFLVVQLGGKGQVLQKS